MSQLLDTRKVPHLPARRFTADWSTAAGDICQDWLDAQDGHNASTVSLVAVSRMKALEYERKNRLAIHEDQRLLPATATKGDYYLAEIDAFLDAVGEKDPQAVLDSFKLVGTGALHRQPATIAATVSNSLSVATVLTPEPVSRLALIGARLLTQAGTSAAIIASGPRRFRNACTEDIMPLGRAATAPAARQAPSMLHASLAAMGTLKMKDVNKSLQQMHTAMQALERAKESGSIKARQETRQQLELAFARMCHKLSVKADYRTASESAKIEFSSGLRHLLTSYTGTLGMLTASMVGIIAPLFVDAVVTGGLLGAATALTVVMYLGYQLSTGPARDGEDGARRAIVALVKMLEVLAGENTDSTRRRGEAYAAYLQDRKVPRFTMRADRKKIRVEALATLMDRLAGIAREDVPATGLDLKSNWDAYSRHRNEARAIAAQAQQNHLAPSEQQQQLMDHDKRFRERHQQDFALEELVAAWKTPMCIRMEAAGRLLQGKAAQSIKRMLALKPGDTPETGHGGAAQAGQGKTTRANRRSRAIERQKQEVCDRLRDMFNLELALQDLQLAEGASAGSVNLARATERIAAITDPDLRHLFCGNAREQVDAIRQSKELTAGESERYNHINMGSAALGITLGIGFSGADLIVSGVGKATSATPAREANYYKMVTLSQVGAQPGAHHNIADHAAYHHRDLRPSLALIKMKVRPPEHHMQLALKHNALLPHDDAVEDALHGLMEDIWKAGVVPRALRLTLQPGMPAAAGQPESAPLPASRETEELAINLKATAAFHRVQYKKSSLAQRMRHVRHLMAIIGRQTAMSVAGLPVQAFAQARVRKAAPALATALESGRTVQALLQPTMFDPQEVPVNGSGLPCLENAHVVVVRTGDRSQAPHPIHAHKIRQQLRSDAGYAAGQSPTAGNLEDVIVQGLESGQGLFQFVSRRAHYEAADSRETPVIGLLQEHLRQHPDKLIGGRYRVLHVNAMAGSGSDCLRHELVAEDTWSASRPILRVPITQAGLKFTDRLLRAPQIARASALMDAHDDCLLQQGKAGTAEKMVLSFAGIGRNATLITYRVLRDAIARGLVTQDSLDAALDAEITGNRIRRGADYVHTPQQWDELRTALSVLITQRDGALMPPASTASA